MLVSDLSWWYG